MTESKSSRNNSMSGVNEVFELGEKGIIERREKFPMAERDWGPLTSSLLSCCYGYVWCASKWKPAVDVESLLCSLFHLVLLRQGLSVQSRAHCVTTCPVDPCPCLPRLELKQGCSIHLDFPWFLGLPLFL